MNTKFNFDGKGFVGAIKQIFTLTFLKKALRTSKQGAIIYLTYFIITEILISGGRSQYDLYLEIVSLIIIISLSAYFTIKRVPQNNIESIKKGFSNLLVFAILDFLAVNLLLESNSGLMYQYWGTLANYTAILAVPYLIYQLKVRKTSTPQTIS